MNSTKLHIRKNGIWKTIFPETYTKLVIREDGNIDLETSLKAIESDLKNVISTKLNKKPDGINDIIVDDKLNSVYIPDVIIGQMQYGGTFSSNNIITSSPYAALVGYSLMSIDPNKIAGFYFIYQGPEKEHTFYNDKYGIGDWAVCNGDVIGFEWARIANTDAVTGIKGAAELAYRKGAVNLSPADIGSPTIAEHETEIETRKNEIERLEQYIANDVKSISNITMEYAQSSSTARPNSWSSAQPSPITGYYMHYRLTTTYTNAVPEYQYFYVKNGPQGEPGAQGAVGYSIIEATFSASKSYTLSSWKTYGSSGHTENWNNCTNASSFRINDIAIIKGTISDLDNTDVIILAIVQSVTTNAIYCKSVALVYGSKGSTGAPGTTPTIKVSAGTNIASVGTPSVSASTSGTTTTFTFNYLKGTKGDKGDKGDNSYSSHYRFFFTFNTYKGNCALTINNNSSTPLSSYTSLGTYLFTAGAKNSNNNVLPATGALTDGTTYYIIVGIFGYSNGDCGLSCIKITPTVTQSTSLVIAADSVSNFNSWTQQ